MSETERGKKKAKSNTLTTSRQWWKSKDKCGFKSRVKFWPKSGPELNNKMRNRTEIKRRGDAIDGIAT